MEAVVTYIFSMFIGIFVAWSVNRGLKEYPFGIQYREEIVAGLTWALTVFYYFHLPYSPLATTGADANSGDLAVGIPWAICFLGFPIVLLPILATLLDKLDDGAFQWLFTVMTAILSYIVFTIAQLAADYVIQRNMQTHPDQFPGAQRMLTAFFAVCGWIGMLYTITLFITLITPIIKTQSIVRSLWSLAVVLPLVFALLNVLTTSLFTYQKATLTDEHGHHAKQALLLESLILWTSFMPNQVLEGAVQNEAGGTVQQTHLACRNLPPEIYIAFVHPDEVVPDKVVVAEPKSGEIAEGAFTYSYRLSACENSINPNGIK